MIGPGLSPGVPRLSHSCRSLLSGGRVQSRRMPIVQRRAQRALDPAAATGTIGREEVGRLRCLRPAHAAG